MGANFANDLASLLPLEQALAHHLTHNHYPPVPAYMVAVCVAAIDAAHADEYDTLIGLPEGVTWRHASRIPANVVISSLHLHAWLPDNDDHECTHDWHYMDAPYAETMKCAHCGDTQR